MADKMTVKQALKAIQTEVNYHAGSDTHYRAEKLEQSLATLRAEIKRLEKDAGRYRWLRKGAHDDIAVVRGLGAMDYGMGAIVPTYSKEIDGDDLDAAIDADRATYEGHDGSRKKILYSAAPPPSVPEQKKLRVGNLATMTDGEYPGLGDWWVQLWDGDEVFARAFGTSPEEARRRAEHIRDALAAMGGQGEGRYPCPRGCDCRGRDCPDCANFTAPQQPEARVGGEVKRYGDLRGTYAATPPPSAVPEIVGWLHEVVWEDGTAYSFYRNQPGLLGPRPGLVSERIGRAAFIAAAPEPGEGEAP